MLIILYLTISITLMIYVVFSLPELFPDTINSIMEVFGLEGTVAKTLTTIAIMAFFTFLIIPIVIIGKIKKKEE